MNSKQIKSHCNECGHKTDHTIIHEEVVSGTELCDGADEYLAHWSVTYRLLKCCGCQDVSLEKSTWFSEYEPDEQYLPEYYPPRVARKKPRWVQNLSEEYHGLLNEIYFALHSDSRRLATMGARSIIDKFIIKNVGDQGNFKKGIKKLQDEGYISEKQREVVEAAIDAGSATTHRDFNPTPAQLDIVMDIIENLIQNEVLGKVAKELKKATPERARKKKLTK